ncbi:MAG: four helix bundle protein [Verrucomicrobiota bacterium]|jgi:four helix bundle protein
MKYPSGRNPKAENRDPKETRNPKPEASGAAIALGEDSESWSWGDDSSTKSLVLREDALPARPPLKDLGERTAQFGEAIVRFAKKIPRNAVNNRLIDQLVGAGTSVGANFCEADNSVSGKDFKQRIGTCRKESKETMFFLRMVATAEESLASEARLLWREAKELNLIFGAIWRK